ncbi:hypothetical protein DNHGIG_25510 [Collibacillus ludicampi]|uniref:C2H2-type domain-containing protein n=1 Tax=Collibacillus ludicampi TaxID=2771369 RepID=A0AAV4LGT1_9BACL|nr:hypothetical protein [Collibacillus ludicampi]GIM47002.1 hypothetical protein DNHGIG_25510 [Collibacillus ludicampi]
MKLKIPFHVYECADCVATFAVEAHEDIDHSVIVCPMCNQESTFSGVADNVLVEFESTNQNED